MNIKQNVSLQPFNTFGINAKASFFLTLKKQETLSEILANDHWRTLPKLILGGGSNILLTQDYPGLVIHNNIKGITVIDENNDHIWLKIGAGENWHQVVLYCVAHNYGGVENLSLIPGTMGAAPMQNIGAYGVEIQSVFAALEAIHLTTGKLHTFNYDDCQFGYRDSIFKNRYKNHFMIINVTLQLDKTPILNTTYGSLATTLEEMSLPPSIQAISQAVIQIRQRKLPDPQTIPNAGSFFKNPIVDHATFKALKNRYPEMPHYSLNRPIDQENVNVEDPIKIPAAWLIEQCGWKGKKVGHAGVHQNQALVIVNYNASASGADLKKLAQTIQQSVKDQFGITLTPEVNII